MAEVIREEHIHEDHAHGSNGLGMIVAAVVLVAVVILLLYYGLPYVRGIGLGGTTQVNVPGQVDVNVNQK